LEKATEAEFDWARWDAEDFDVVEVDFEVVDDDLDDDPQPASARTRPTVAGRVSFLSMILMMSDRGTPLPHDRSA
jgi:hypothetical protein